MKIKDMIVEYSLREEKDYKMDGKGPHGKGMGPGKGKGDCKGMQAAGATYKEYKKAVMNKFDAKNMKELGKEGAAFLDKYWKAKDE